MPAVKNKVGIEVEYFLRDTDGNLLIPSDYGFLTDEYVLLGEIRADCGESIGETLGNFSKAFYDTRKQIELKGLVMDIDSGWSDLSPEFNAKVNRKMGTKYLNQSLNLYGTDILEFSDNIVEDGKITSVRRSIGTHIHFSSNVSNKIDVKADNLYVPVSLPLSLFEGVDTELKLWKLASEGGTKYTKKVSVSRITKPVVDYFVRQLDEKLLPNFTEHLPELKFRQPGFYEYKNWGFEYRSLPFNVHILDEMYEVVKFAFDLLGDL